MIKYGPSSNSTDINNLMLLFKCHLNILEYMYMTQEVCEDIRTSHVARTCFNDLGFMVSGYYKY